MNEIQPSSNGRGRTPKGTFAPGNKLGKGGNPKADIVHKYRLRMMAPGCLGIAVEELIKLVAAGNLEAIKLVLSYALGKPREVIDLHAQIHSIQVNVNYADVPAPVDD